MNEQVRNPPREEWMTLSSGKDIRLDRPDFSIIKTEDDFVEVTFALQERIIEIELNIELEKERRANLADQGTLDRTWRPRAEAALKWAKLYRAECQQRQGLLAKREKAQRTAMRDATVGQRFIDAARNILPKETWDQIMSEATRGVDE